MDCLKDCFTPSDLEENDDSTDADGSIADTESSSIHTDIILTPPSPLPPSEQREPLHVAGSGLEGHGQPPSPPEAAPPEAGESLVEGSGQPSNFPVPPAAAPAGPVVKGNGKHNVVRTPHSKATRKPEADTSSLIGKSHVIHFHSRKFILLFIRTCCINDQCRSMNINIDHYFSITISANQCLIRGCY